MGKSDSNDKPAKDNSTPDADSAATGAEGSIAGGPADEVATAKKEAAAAQDRYLRAMADLENFRRRTVREKDELRLFGASRILEDLLPVLDNLSLGLAAARQPKADLKTLTDGMDLVAQQLKSALAGHGLTEISPVGKPFDPHQHEAISHQPSDEVAAENVLTVVRTGYSLNGRLIRPASVVVSSGPAKGGKS